MCDAPVGLQFPIYSLRCLLASFHFGLRTYFRCQPTEKSPSCIPCLISYISERVQLECGDNDFVGGLSCKYLQSLYGLWEALFVAELVHNGVTTGNNKCLTWETHTIDLAFDPGKLSVSFS